MRFKPPSAGYLFGTALAFASAGLAVILTKGQTTWVPQNHWLAPALFSGGGGLFLWSLFRFFRTSPARIWSGLRHIEQTAIHPATHGIGSPALAAGRDIHVNYGTTASIPQPVPGSTVSKPAGADPRPNLKYVGPKEKFVFVSPLSRDGICDPRTLDERTKALKAFVLKFENQVLPDRKIARATVIAKIRFKSADRATQRLIDYGVWLNSPGNSTDIGIGDTQELVLICDLEDKLVSFEDRRDAGHQFYDQFSYIDDGTVDGLEIVEISLIDKRTQASLNCKFRVWRDGGFCISEL
jgi:hypothetical protein